MKNVLVLLFIIFFTFTSFAGSDEDLFTACKAGDFEAAAKAIEAGADVNATDDGNYTPISVSFFWPDIVKLLLEKGADPNGGDYPALVQACNNYSLEVLKLLLEAGADPNKSGLVDPAATLKILIATEKKKGDDANDALVKAWENAIQYAGEPTELKALQVTVQQTNFVPGLKLILEHGVDVSVSDELAPLHHLLSYSMSPEGRKALFTKGAESMVGFGFAVPDWYRSLPDDVNGTSVEMLEMLLTKDFDLNKKNAQGLTPLVVALKSIANTGPEEQNKITMAKALLKHGADPKITAIQNLTSMEIELNPVNLAAEFGDQEMMQMMVEKGVDINFEAEGMSLSKYPDLIGGEGFTPVIIAIMNDNLDIAGYLVDHGADLKTGVSGDAIMEISGFEEIKCFVKVKAKTPIYWAVEKNDIELTKKIADKMVWKFNPKFTYKVLSTAKFSDGYGCKKGKKKMYPSAYADLIGNEEASKYLVDKGL